MSFGKNYSLFNDLHELERLLSSFENYLKSSAVYGTVGGGYLTGGSAPQLTVGAVLLRMRRLNLLADDLDAPRRKTLERLVTQHNAIRDRNYAQYTAKMEREALSRLDAMTRFFEECRAEPESCDRLYNPEVLRRTIVQEIIQVMDDLGVYSQPLEHKAMQVDKRLRTWVRESDFVWDSQLEEIYPKSPYWWMWMRPQG